MLTFLLAVCWIFFSQTSSLTRILLGTMLSGLSILIIILGLYDWSSSSWRIRKLATSFLSFPGYFSSKNQTYRKPGKRTEDKPWEPSIPAYAAFTGISVSNGQPATTVINGQLPVHGPQSSWETIRSTHVADAAPPHHLRERRSTGDSRHRRSHIVGLSHRRSGQAYQMREPRRTRYTRPRMNARTDRSSRRHSRANSPAGRRYDEEGSPRTRHRVWRDDDTSLPTRNRRGVSRESRYARDLPDDSFYDHDEGEEVRARRPRRGRGYVGRYQQVEGTGYSPVRERISTPEQVLRYGYHENSHAASFPPARGPSLPSQYTTAPVPYIPPQPQAVFGNPYAPNKPLNPPMSRTPARVYIP